jgi:hypothetical protein
MVTQFNTAAIWLTCAACLLTIFVVPAVAQVEPRHHIGIEAERYLRLCNNAIADTRRRCEANRQAFLQAYVRARSGDYQAQRTVARLLAAAPGSASATSPFSAVVPDRVEACVWRIIIINSDHLDARDEARERRDCGRLTDSEHLVADLRASEFLALIARTPAGNGMYVPDAAGGAS